MEVIIVSDRAEKVWIIIGITAAIGFLVFLGFNFMNMFSYLSYLPLVVTIYYVIWIATSLVILFIDLNKYWKFFYEAILTLTFFLTFVICINSNNDWEGKIIYLNLGWGIVSFVIHAGLLYLLGFGFYKLKKFIIRVYVQKQISRNIQVIENIISDSLSAEKISTGFLWDTYYLSSFIKLINSLSNNSDSIHLRESFLKKNEEDYKTQYNTIVTSVPESYQWVFPKRYEDLLSFSTITNRHRNGFLQIKEKFNNATKVKEIREIEVELYQYINNQQIQYTKGAEK